VATLEAVEAKLPNLAAVHYHLGMSYAATGQAEKAKDQLNKAFSLEPDGTPLKESIRSAMKVIAR
jgi:cellulose synthase operon protein C